jgi:hypothetical protein
MLKQLHSLQAPMLLPNFHGLELQNYIRLSPTTPLQDSMATITTFAFPW